MPRVTLRHDFCGRAWRHARPGHVPPPADPRLAARGRLPAAYRSRRRAACRPGRPGRPQSAAGLAAVGCPAARSRAPVRPARDGSPVTGPRRTGGQVLRPRLAPADGGRDHRHLPRAGAVHVPGCRRNGARSPPDRRRPGLRGAPRLRCGHRRRDRQLPAQRTAQLHRLARRRRRSAGFRRPAALRGRSRPDRGRRALLASGRLPRRPAEDPVRIPGRAGRARRIPPPFPRDRPGAAVVRGARQPRQHDAGHGPAGRRGRRLRSRRSEAGHAAPASTPRRYSPGSRTPKSTRSPSWQRARHSPSRPIRAAPW